LGRLNLTDLHFNFDVRRPVSAARVPSGKQSMLTPQRLAAGVHPHHFHIVIELWLSACGPSF
jgi:hypothetical protein